MAGGPVASAGSIGGAARTAPPGASATAGGLGAAGGASGGAVGSKATSVADGSAATSVGGCVGSRIRTGVAVRAGRGVCVGARRRPRGVAVGACSRVGKALGNVLSNARSAVGPAGTAGARVAGNGVAGGAVGGTAATCAAVGRAGRTARGGGVRTTQGAVAAGCQPRLRCHWWVVSTRP